MKPIKINLKTEIVPLILLGVIVVSSFYFYSHFPEKVPSHWNFRGEVDAWSNRRVASFTMPMIIFGLYLLFLLLPILDPKKERYEQFSKTYHIFKISIIFFMAAAYFLVGLNGLGYAVPVGNLIPIMIGILFLVLGNYMPKIKPNWFMGIRTPWTMSSEKVWNKTHRLGGKIFILSGLVFMFINFFPENIKLPLFILVILSLSLGTMVYSYYLFYQEKKQDENNKQLTK